MLFAQAEVAAQTIDWSRFGPMWLYLGLTLVTILGLFSAIGYAVIRMMQSRSKTGEKVMMDTMKSAQESTKDVVDTMKETLKDLSDTMKEHVKNVSEDIRNETEQCRSERKEMSAMFVQAIREEREGYRQSLAEIRDTFINKLDQMTIIPRKKPQS